MAEHKTQKTSSTFPRPVFLGAPVRSPIGKFGGALKSLSAPALAMHVLKECHKRAGSPQADLVLMGHARQAGAGPNTARQAGIGAGLVETVPAITVNQACASGLTAILWGAQNIALGRANSVFAGGVESMSNTPYLLPRVRFGLKMGHAEVLDGMHQDGFFCPMAQMVMGETVERYLVAEFKIPRAEQDEFALRSQKRAAQAWSSGLFSSEVVPIAELNHDEHLRPDTSLEGLSKLPAVFGGTITAGTSSGITDGSAWVHLSATRLESPVAEILDYEIVAVDPRRMGMGPVNAIRALCSRHQLKWEDFKAIEINEAFAAQVIACQRELKIPPEQLNPRGGAIALGHPIGASGARITVTLVHQLSAGELGIAALCVSGGQGIAILVRAL